MNWRCFETSSLLFVDKPDGLPTVGTAQAWMERWEKHLGHRLWPVHNLDASISGATVFAKSEAAATRCRLRFEKREVQEVFWLITDRHVESDLLDAASANTKTRFTRIKRSPFFELWEARPEPGKAQRISLHARDLGIPILGDTSNGGSPFARICLHSQEMRIPGEEPWICSAPRLFERLGLLKAPEICEALCAIDRRQRQFDFLNQPHTCLRLMEFEVPGLQLDLLGPQLWLQWFREEDPTPRELERWAVVSRILDRPLLIQKRWNRGEKTGPAPKWRTDEFQDVWTASENAVTYEFRADSGESHGLFLDQRINRQKLAERSRGKSLLNLFAYTSGFSLVAAKSGATKVTSVDLSAAAIAWSQRNFELNPSTDCQLEFFAADCFFFLERAQKRQRLWDLIVCDPPIFSRGQRIFRIEKDLIYLVNLCKAVLAPQGTLFFSTHFEQWDYSDIEKLLKKAFPEIKIERGRVGDDVPQPPSSLKSFFLRF